MPTIPRSVRLGALTLVVFLSLSCTPTTQGDGGAVSRNQAGVAAATTVAVGASIPAAKSTVAPPSVSGGPAGELQLLVTADPHFGPPAYDRSQWPLWIDEDHDCQDARQEVLIAESRTAVTFAAGSTCRVVAGTWFDEYTGTSTTNPGDFDIDHLVPLENAHISGGWSWSIDKRRAYANDLSHAEQLIAVSASANRSKGSQAPDTWKPPRHEYWCEYASSWVAVKDRWSLTVTTSERSALLVMLGTCPSQGTPVGATTLAPPPAFPVSPTPAAAPTFVPTSVPTSVARGSCDSSYPDVCIPPFPPDLNCADIPFRRFRVVGPDPHRFDGDHDGIGCES